MLFYFLDFFAEVARELAGRWARWDGETPLNFSQDFTVLTTGQQQEFLAALIKRSPLPPATLEELDCLYNLASSGNYYILVPFIRLGLKSRWEPSAEKALEIVRVQGTYEFTRQLYKDLYAWEDKRQLALDAFLHNKNKYMDVVVNGVMQDLNLD